MELEDRRGAIRSASRAVVGCEELGEGVDGALGERDKTPNGIDRPYGVGRRLTRRVRCAPRSRRREPSRRRRRGRCADRDRGRVAGGWRRRERRGGRDGRGVRDVRECRQRDPVRHEIVQRWRLVLLPARARLQWLLRNHAGLPLRRSGRLRPFDLLREPRVGRRQRLPERPLLTGGRPDVPTRGGVRARRWLRRRHGHHGGLRFLRSVQVRSRRPIRKRAPLRRRGRRATPSPTRSRRSAP
jgi:hypothetical protein